MRLDLYADGDNWHIALVDDNGEAVEAWPSFCSDMLARFWESVAAGEDPDLWLSEGMGGWLPGNPGRLIASWDGWQMVSHVPREYLLRMAAASAGLAVAEKVADKLP